MKRKLSNLTCLILMLSLVFSSWSVQAYGVDSLEVENESEYRLKPYAKSTLDLMDTQVYSETQLGSIYLKFASDKLLNKRTNTLKLNQEDLLFSNSNISVRKIYPNPASASAYLDYNVIENIQAKVTIRNILGRVIQEYNLNQGNRKLRIPTVNFDPGIYLYTLSIDGKAKSSRKLVVKHN